MKSGCFTILFLGFVVLNLFGQKSINLQTHQGIETGYGNEVVSFPDGYFVLLSSYDFPGNNKEELLITKFDNCHVIIWNKRYTSSTDVDIQKAIWDEDKLVILAGSGLKYPLIIMLDVDGEIILCNSYKHSTFDNPYNLEKGTDGYHFFGPSDGVAQFSIDFNGDFAFANIIKTSLSETEIEGTRPFGSGALKNGTFIRRIGNVLACVDINNNILWAHHFFIDWNGFGEKCPLDVDDGFILTMELDEQVLIVKLDYDGHIIWSSPNLNIRHTTASLRVSNNNITVVSQTNTNPRRLSYIELSRSTGEVLKNEFFEFAEYNGFNFPTHDHTTEGDLIISGSILIDFGAGDWEDMLVVNPSHSGCHDILEHTQSPGPNIAFEDITETMSIVPFEVMQEQHSLNVYEEEDFYFTQCIDKDIMVIDTFLSCQGSYLFNNPFPGAEYLWEDGLSDSVRLFNTTTNTYVEVSDCYTQKIIQLDIGPFDCQCNLYLPNIININSDNIDNQTFRPFSNCDLNQYEMSIYDRWGNRVFHSNDFSTFWNGELKGNKVLSGVYVYHLEYSFHHLNEMKNVSGHFTLLK